MTTSDDLARRWAPTLTISRNRVEYVVPEPSSIPTGFPTGLLRVASSPTPEDVESEVEDAPEHTGIMVALFPTLEQAQAIAIDGGEAPEELHVTLTYLGDAADEGAPAEDQLIGVITGWAATHAPFSAAISGIGVFANNPPVTYLSIDAPELPALRQDLCTALAAAGAPVNAEHGFTPHLTLAYSDERTITPPASVLTFSGAVLVYAGNRTVFAFTPPATLDVGPGPMAQANLQVSDRAQNAGEAEAPETEPIRAFVTSVPGRTLITAPVTAGMSMPTLADITKAHLLWMNGRLVGADEPNRNNAMWSSGDLQMGRASVVNGPLNWLHEERHVIGTLATADFVEGSGPKLSGQSTSAATQAHIATTAAIWRWIYPEEAYVVQQASDQSTLWLSMECISRQVACVGPNGCGHVSTYEQFTSKLACAHLNQHASIARFVDPVFLGAAIIVPPTRPGWANADATVMTKALAVAEAAYDEAGQPDISASDWEQLMAQVVGYALTPS